MRNRFLNLDYIFNRPLRSALVIPLVACLGAQAHARPITAAETNDHLAPVPVTVPIDDPNDLVTHLSHGLRFESREHDPAAWPTLKGCQWFTNDFGQTHLHGGGKVVLEISPNGVCSVTFDPNIQENK